MQCCFKKGFRAVKEGVQAFDKSHSFPIFSEKERATLLRLKGKKFMKKCSLS